MGMKKIALATCLGGYAIANAESAAENTVETVTETLNEDKVDMDKVDMPEEDEADFDMNDMPDMDGMDGDLDGEHDDFDMAAFERDPRGMMAEMMKDEEFAKVVEMMGGEEAFLSMMQQERGEGEPPAFMSEEDELDAMDMDEVVDSANDEFYDARETAEDSDKETSLTRQVADTIGEFADNAANVAREYAETGVEKLKGIYNDLTSNGEKSDDL